jgi:hypothetical protein
MSRGKWIRFAALLLATHMGSIVVAGYSQNKVVRPRAGAAGEWRLIGQVTANFTADHDVIVVKGPFDNFRQTPLSTSRDCSSPTITANPTAWRFVSRSRKAGTAARSTCEASDSAAFARSSSGTHGGRA